MKHIKLIRSTMTVKNLKEIFRMISTKGTIKIKEVGSDDWEISNEHDSKDIHECEVQGIYTSREEKGTMFVEYII